MNKIIITLILFIGFSCSNNEEEQSKVKQSERRSNMKTIGSFSVAFYNVDNLFDIADDPLTSDDEFTPNGEKKWTEKRYQHKLKNIASVFKGIDAELPLFIGVCEVENKKVLVDLTNENLLKAANYGVVHYNSPDTRGIDVGFLYKKDFFNVLLSESLVINYINNPNVLTRDILYVKGEVNNEVIHVFVNHWSSRRNGEKETEYKRLEAAKVLKNRIESIQERSPDDKVLIMGDFNDYPNNRSIVNVLEATLQPESDEFYNLAAKLDNSEKGTHFYNEEWGMLDQMMVSNSWLTSKSGNVLKKKSVEVYKDDKVLFNHKSFGAIPNKTYSGNKYHGGYSDHLAISLKFKYKK
jgi:predicted extracellular nuclease